MLRICVVVYFANKRIDVKWAPSSVDNRKIYLYIQHIFLYNSVKNITRQIIPINRDYRIIPNKFVVLKLC